MFRPSTTSTFLSPYYAITGAKRRIDTNNISQNKSPIDEFSDNTSTTAYTYDDQELELSGDEDCYYFSKEGSPLFNQPSFRPEGSLASLPNVYSSAADTYISTSLMTNPDNLMEKSLCLPKLAWIDTSAEALDEDDGHEEITHSMEQEVDLDELPYVHVPIIDPEATGYGTGEPEVIGYLKVAVRIYQPDQTERYDSQLAIVEHHMSIPVNFKIRIHIISAQGLLPTSTVNPWDLTGASSATTNEEPSWYLCVANGSAEGGRTHQITGEQHIATGYSPEFYRSFELDATLPYNAMQEITVIQTGGSGGMWMFGGTQDKQPFGRTLIDIEDRIYHSEYVDITEQGMNVPIELRALRQVGNAIQVGTIKGWLEILSIEESIRRPLEPLIMPRVEVVQVRMPLWRIKGIPLDKEETVSLYVRALVTRENGQIDIQETDTHWNSNDGTGSFNWRFVFSLDVPCQTPGVKIQIWNRNILSAHEVIAECFFDLSSDLAKAAKTRTAVKIPKMWYRLTHPSNPDTVKGAAELEIEILPNSDAEGNPVGVGRDEPNRDPFLPPIEENREMFKTSSIGQGFFAVQSKVQTATTFIFIAVCLTIFLTFFSFVKWFF